MKSTKLLGLQSDQAYKRLRTRNLWVKSDKQNIFAYQILDLKISSSQTFVLYAWSDLLLFPAILESEFY